MNCNSLFLGGNLTRDPEVKFINGTAVARVGLALNESWLDEQGNKNERVTFVDVALFGKSAENFAKYHKKGSPAFFPNAQLRLDVWNDKTTGEKRYKLYVVARGWQFCGARREDAAPANGPESAPLNGAESFSSSPTPGASVEVDDGPF